MCSEPIFATDPLFHAEFTVPFHAVKKNGKSLYKNRASGQMFVGSNKRVKEAEKEMCQILQLVKKRHTHLNFPLTEDIHLEVIFTFKDYFTKHMVRRKTLPDLSNLIELPQDCLQKVGIIENDSQVCFLDGSRRKPGSENKIEIYLWRCDERLT